MRIEKYKDTILMLQSNRKEARDQIKRFTSWQRSILYWHGSHHALVMPMPASLLYFERFDNGEQETLCDHCEEEFYSTMYVQASSMGYDLWLCPACHNAEMKAYKKEVAEAKKIIAREKRNSANIPPLQDVVLEGYLKEDDLFIGKECYKLRYRHIPQYQDQGLSYRGEVFIGDRYIAGRWGKNLNSLLEWAEGFMRCEDEN